MASETIAITSAPANFSLAAEHCEIKASEVAINLHYRSDDGKCNQVHKYTILRDFTSVGGD